MMTLFFNSELVEMTKNLSLIELLILKKYTNDYCAIALNRKFIPRAHYATTILKENDVIEIITPMQGG